MCNRNTYVISVSGEKSGADVIIGTLVRNSANLTGSFSLSRGAVSFPLRYRSDGRILLRRLMRLLAVKESGGDLFEYAGAKVELKKLS